MKILKVCFENINSLAGRWEIDFTSPEYQDGIFLICGETGSGKTTILDAISLALYSRTVREQISSTSNEVMTRGTGVARAEAEFECRQGRFRAIWEQRRAYGRSLGSLQGVCVMLMDCESGRFIADGTRTDTLEKIRELVGLTFEQFQRTMMLAQGKFDQFLSATESERAEILQQAAGTQIYERIGRRIFERRRQAEAAVATLLTKIGETRVFGADELAARTSELRMAADKSKGLAKELDVAQGRLAGIAKAEAALADAEKDLRRREKELAACVVGAEKAAQSLLAADESLAGAAAAFAESAPRMNDAIALKGKMALANKDAEAKNAQLSALRSARQDEVAEEAEEHGRIERSQCVLSVVGDALDQRIFAKPAKAGMARDANVKLAAEYVRLATEDGGDERDGAALREGAQRQAEACAAMEDEWRKLRPVFAENLENAQRAYEASIAYASLEDWRARLEDGRACPLCGSLHHPFAEHSGAPQKSVCEEALAKAKVAIAKLDERRDAAREGRDRSQAAWEAYARQREAKRARLEDARTRLLAARSALASSIAAGEDALARICGRLAKIDAQIAAAAAECAKSTSVVDELKRRYEALGAGPSPEKALARLQTALDAAKARQATAKAGDSAAKASLAGAQREAEAAAARKTACSEALTAATRQGGVEIDRTALASDIARLKAEKAAADARCGELGAELRGDAEMRRRLAEYNDELADAKECAVRWTNLDKWLGGARGEQFKRFAHGITLRQLLAFANPHLRRMTSGRYQMEWNAAGSQGCEKLLPSLIDDEQGGVKRPVSNLSGGERFQVSLALALGLSEMSSARLDVESLFLDEGFGTLDDTTLEAALDTLCAVQQDGKLIGVISHVSGVAERLATQIRVSKSGNGRSTLAGPGIRKIV